MSDGHIRPVRQRRTRDRWTQQEELHEWVDKHLVMLDERLKEELLEHEKIQRNLVNQGRVANGGGLLAMVSITTALIAKGIDVTLVNVIPVWFFAAGLLLSGLFEIYEERLYTTFVKYLMFEQGSWARAKSAVSKDRLTIFSNVKTFTDRRNQRLYPRTVKAPPRYVRMMTLVAPNVAFGCGIVTTVIYLTFVLIRTV